MCVALKDSSCYLLTYAEVKNHIFLHGDENIVIGKFLPTTSYVIGKKSQWKLTENIIPGNLCFMIANVWN